MGISDWYACCSQYFAEIRRQYIAGINTGENTNQSNSDLYGR